MAKPGGIGARVCSIASTSWIKYARMYGYDISARKPQFKSPGMTAAVCRAAGESGFLLGRFG